MDYGLWIMDYVPYPLVPFFLHKMIITILNRLRGFLESSVTEQLLTLTNSSTSRKMINNDYCDEVKYG